jgi:hypothetical protein
MIESIIAEIDKEIASLQQVRAVLAGLSLAPSVESPRRGRKKGSKNAAAAAPVKAKRVMSDEGRARISAAMKKRHAAKKRAAKKEAAAQVAK